MSKFVNRDSIAQVIINEMNLSKRDALHIVDLMFDEMSSALMDGGKIDISGFGKFSIFFRKARMGINPITKERMEIPASKVPKFKPSQTLKNKCNEKRDVEWKKY